MMEKVIMSMRINIIKTIFCRSILGLCLPMLVLPVLSGQEEPEAPVPAKALSDQEILEAYGWLIGQEKGLYIGYTDDELRHIVQGILLAARGAPGPENLDDTISHVEVLVRQRLEAFQERQEQRNSETAAGNLVTEETFFSELGKNPNILKTDSGLFYEMVDEGIGRRPSGNDVMRVHYEGALIDGQVFDSSIQRGSPTDFSLTDVIPGFAEGLKLVREGGKIKLYVPAYLGYQDRPVGIIPPGSTLIFDIELIEVNPIDELEEPQR